jgi:hypothetical protein
MNGSCDRANYVTAVGSAIEIGPKETLAGHGRELRHDCSRIDCERADGTGKNTKAKAKGRDLGDGAVADEGLDAT